MQLDYALLQGTHVRLEPLEAAHGQTLRTLARDERIWEFTKTLLVDEHYNEQFDRYLADALNPAFSGLQCSLVMRDAQTGQVMGMTRYYKIEPTHQRLSIGYTWYTPAYWGRVHNKECKWLLLRYAFETLGYRRVEFEVAHQNLRSQKAVEKIGGVREGMLRKHMIRPDGVTRHTVVFSVIDDEWPAVNTALQALLAAQKENKP